MKDFNIEKHRTNNFIRKFCEQNKISYSENGILREFLFKNKKKEALQQIEKDIIKLCRKIDKLEELKCILQEDCYAKESMDSELAI